MIPFIWALNVSSKSAVIERFNFLKEHFLKIIGAVIVVILVGCIQLIYWKYVGGDWIIYSYEDQGFNWLKPYIYECAWENNERNVHFDIRQPEAQFDKISIEFWNGTSDKEIIIRNLRVEVFDE